MKPEQTRDAVHETLRQELAEEPSIPLRWVLVLEKTDADGDKELVELTSADTYQWEKVGMLTFALDSARGLTAEADDYDGED